MDQAKGHLGRLRHHACLSVIICLCLSLRPKCYPTLHMPKLLLWLLGGLREEALPSRKGPVPHRGTVESWLDQQLPCPLCELLGRERNRGLLSTLRVWAEG